jgi:hypothetical protein
VNFDVAFFQMVRVLDVMMMSRQCQHIAAMPWL